MGDCVSLAGVLECAGSLMDKGITFIEGDNLEKFISYKNLYDTAFGTLYNLQSRGIKSGDTVILQLEDNESFVYVFWACILGKIIPVPLSVGKNDEHKRKVLRICEILKNPYMVTGEKQLAALEKFSYQSNYAKEMGNLKERTFISNDIVSTEHKGTQCEIVNDDIAFIQFSSGSTGDPKGVILTHGNLLANISAMKERGCVDPEDKVLQWMPLTHDMGIIGFHLLPVVCKVNQYLIPTTLFIKNPLLWMKKVSKHRATITCSPNFGYRYMLSFFKDNEEYGWDLSSVRLIVNGAEPISAELCQNYLDKMRKYNLNPKAMYNVYGLAEASLGVSFPDLMEGIIPLKLKRDSIYSGQKVAYAQEDDKHVTFVELGYALEDCKVKICDDDKKPVEENVVGNIWIKGKNVTKGYYNNPEATENIIDKEGWLNTGDLGFLRGGKLVVTGRAKDIIFIDAQNFYSHDIERLVTEINGVTLGEVAVCSTIDEETKEESLIVFVLFKKSLENFAPIAVDIKKHINNTMGIKVKHIIPVKRLYKTTSGKIQRFKMEEAYQNGDYNETVTLLEKLVSEHLGKQEVKKPSNEIEEKLLSIWREVLDGEEIGVTDNFFDRGGNSTLLVQMAARVEAEYPDIISLANVFSCPTIAELAEYIKKNSSSVLSASAIILPSEYFNVSEEEAEEIFEFGIRPELSEKLLLLSNKAGVEIEDIFLGTYIYLLHKITGSESITVQTMLNQQNTIRPIAIDFQDVSDTKQLFCMVEEKRKMKDISDEYSLDDLGPINGNTDNLSVLPLFYAKNLLDMNIRLTDVYDIVFEANRETDRITFLCEYNGKRLSKQKVKEIISQYLSLIDAAAGNS